MVKFMPATKPVVVLISIQYGIVMGIDGLVMTEGVTGMLKMVKIQIVKKIWSRLLWKMKFYTN